MKFLKLFLITKQEWNKMIQDMHNCVQIKKYKYLEVGEKDND